MGYSAFSADHSSFQNAGKPESLLAPGAERTIFVGEIKGRSYIKMSLQPASARSTNVMILYRGAYYEAAKDRTYTLIGTFNTTNRVWYIKCFNAKKQCFASFQGREREDGYIDGTWQQFNQTLPFYLFKRDTKT